LVSIPMELGIGPAPFFRPPDWISGTRRPHNSAGRARIIPPHPRAIARESAAELGNIWQFRNRNSEIRDQRMGCPVPVK
jgi:hypothetical protein